MVILIELSGMFRLRPLHSKLRLKTSPSDRSATGFTLVELLVVIAIIALLAALIFPVVGKMRARAAQTKCAANLRTWGIAILRYSQENNGYVNYDKWASAASAHYNPYFGVEAISVSGRDQKTTPQEYYRWCPAMEWDKSGSAPVGYAFMRPSVQKADGTYGLEPASATGGSYNLRRAQRPSQLLFMMDAIKNAGATLEKPGDLDTLVRPICTGKDERHSGSVNALFADGHISTYQWSDIDQDTPAEQEMVANWFHLD